MSLSHAELRLGQGDLATHEDASRHEWLCTNGLGGFAAGTVGLTCTRRYHGLLVAALHPPVQRTLLVAKVDAAVRYDNRTFALSSNEYADGTVHPNGHVHLAGFTLKDRVPIWSFIVADVSLRQLVFMAHGENTTHVRWTLERASEPVELELAPLCTYRDYHAHGTHGSAPTLRPIEGGVEITAFEQAVPYRLYADRGGFTEDTDWFRGFRHRAETRRGLDDLEDLFRPGRFRATLAPGDSVTLTLTAEPGPVRSPRAALAARRERVAAADRTLPADTPAWCRELARAADDFIVTRREAGGDGATIIAGYPWFADWGRDTMIALPGLCLVTGNYAAAADVLRTFARYVDRGMLPNRFPDAGEPPEYNTVDASLWYFHALDRYVRESGDRSILDTLYPVLTDIIDRHLEGTRYGIRATEDGLLTAGEPGVQLTWMDARVGERVITPRMGKPVEINALWYRALDILARFAADRGAHDDHVRFTTAARRVAASFEARFWNAEGGYLNDVVDTPDKPTDATLRPNQIIAAAVAPELLAPERLRSVVEVCGRRLWTPLGLRTLDSADPAYVARYAGDSAHRDSAYHQGTVWAWLLGSFAQAHFHAHGDAARALAHLDGVADHLRDVCVGHLSEVFDGDPPHAPEGCFAQAWSVAGVLEAFYEINRASTHERRALTGA